MQLQKKLDALATDLIQSGLDIVKLDLTQIGGEDLWTLAGAGALRERSGRWHCHARIKPELPTETSRSDLTFPVLDGLEAAYSVS